MRNIKLNQLDIILFFCFLVIINVQLVPYTYKIPLEAVLVLIIFVYVINRITLREVLNVPSICLLGIMGLSILNYMYGRISSLNIVECIIHYVGLIMLYDVLMIYYKKNRCHQMIKCLFHIFLFYLVANFISVCIVGVDDINNLLYIFGNKFRVGYCLIYFIGLTYCYYYLKIERNIVNKVLFLLLISLGVIFLYYINCKTTVVALVVFFVLMMIFRNKSKLLVNPFFYLGITVASGFIILVIDVILSNPAVIKIISMLNEDVSLTGRTRVYSNYLFYLLGESKYIGFGYGNTAMWNYSRVFGNAQNGMFDYILNNGIIGFVLLLLIMVLCLKAAPKKSINIGLYYVLLVMILIGVVEVSFGVFLYVALFIIRWYDSEREKAIIQFEQSTTS